MFHFIERDGIWHKFYMNYPPPLDTISLNCDTKFGDWCIPLYVHNSKRLQSITSKL